MMIIYKATNLVNNKIYIGKTAKPLSKRKSCHLAHAKAGSNNYFHKAIRKYGKENFVWEIVDQCLFSESLIAMEIYYIEKFNCRTPNGYNLTAGGEGMFGYKYSEEARQKMSDSHIGKQLGVNHPMYGRHHSEESKEKMRAGHKGKLLSKEHKRKIGDAGRGRRNSLETIEKMRRAQIGEKNHNWGKPMSEEQKRKISIANTGKRKVVEQCALS